MATSASDVRAVTTEELERFTRQLGVLLSSGVEMLRKQLRKKGVCIAAAMLAGLMRDHGAQAAPAELMQEAGA